MKILVVHKNDLGAQRFAKEFCDSLQNRGISADYVRSHHLIYNRFTQPDVVFVLGGVGTHLKTSRHFASQETPIICVNLGTVGFLSSIEPEDIIDALELLLQGKYEVEKRLMIDVQLLRDNLDRSYQTFALNDAVIKTRASHTIEINLRVDGLLYTTYQGDGVICATPTGSTAYSLSAGGPILDSSISALVVTPICPQLSSSRPLVIGASSRLEFELDSAYVTCLNIDGEEEIPILKGDIIRITQSSVAAQVVRFCTTSSADKVLSISRKKGQKQAGSLPELQAESSLIK